MTEARTERVSPRKLAAAGDRRPISRALCGAAALVALGLAVDAQSVPRALEPSFALAFAAAGAANPELDGAAALGASVRALAAILAPLLAASLLAVIAVSALQVLTVTMPAARGERPSPFDVAARLRQLLAPERLLDAAIAFVMLVVLATVAWLTLAPSLRGVLALSSADPHSAARSVLALLGVLAFRLVVAGLVLGALDYLQRRVRHALSLRMTPRELRDEQREQYGDPGLRAERSRRMRAGASTKGRS
jgi:flagellar biosynthetic protein FlhB